MWCTDEDLSTALQGVLLSFLLLFDVQATILLHHALKWIHTCELANECNVQVGIWGLCLGLYTYVLGLLFANTAASNKHDVTCFHVPDIYIVCHSQTLSTQSLIAFSISTYAEILKAIRPCAERVWLRQITGYKSQTTRYTTYCC